MSAGIIEGAVILSQLMLAVAMGLCLARMAIGPRAQARILALDAFYVAAMLLLVTLGIRTGSTLYYEASVIIALLAFGVGFFTGNRIVGRTADRFGALPTLTAGLVAAGAVPVSSGELVRRLIASGLRVTARQRRGR